MKFAVGVYNGKTAQVITFPTVIFCLILIVMISGALHDLSVFYLWNTMKDMFTTDFYFDHTTQNVFFYPKF